jgi:hypothetical protein
MDRPALLRLACQGDEIAIATLLAADLRMSVSHLQVRFNKGYLQIILTEKRSRPQTVQQIHQTLQGVRALGLRQIRVWSYASPGDRNLVKNPLWTETFSLKTIPGAARSRAHQQSDNLRPANSSGNRSPHRSTPRSLPDWIREKPDPVKWARLLHTHFDMAKLVVILLIAGYGLFYHATYSIDAVLNSQQIFVTRILHGANLIFHEAGHMIFMIFGQFMHVLGGSLTQILIPAGITAHFIYHRQRFSAAVTLAWMAENFWDVSIYIKDAQLRELPLIVDNIDAHDWHNLLTWMGMLSLDRVIGNLVFFLGIVIYITAVAWGIYQARIADFRHESADC